MIWACFKASWYSAKRCTRKWRCEAGTVLVCCIARRHDLRAVPARMDAHERCTSWQNLKLRQGAEALLVHLGDARQQKLT